MTLTNFLKQVVPRYVLQKKTVRELTSSGLTRYVVDFSDWLHTALYAAAEYLAREDIQNALSLINGFFRKRIIALQGQGVTKLCFVLDGAELPAKSSENQSRREAQERALNELRQLREQGGDIPRDLGLQA